MNKEIEELKQKIDYFETKREEILAAINSLKGQRELLNGQKTELITELNNIDCKNSKDLEEKINQLKFEIDSFRIDIPDDILCNLQ